MVCAQANWFILFVTKLKNKSETFIVGLLCFISTYVLNSWLIYGYTRDHASPKFSGDIMSLSGDLERRFNKQSDS